MQVNAGMLTFVVDKQIRVLQAAKPLLNEVRFQVVVAVQRNRDARAVWVLKNTLPVNEPPALGVPLGHRVALLEHCESTAGEGERRIRAARVLERRRGKG